ncbi:MAG: M28 family peptidase [Ignavibacteriae bacterium]|nr:M28 family peptidase [Ignavibacteriota bacterium]
MGSPAEREAMQFAVDKFKQYGCDTAYIMPFTKTSRVNTNSGIAVGIKRGASERIIVIGGHIDSAEPEIPGANDDGSGTAVVLEASRVLSSSPHQSTLLFCCFGGEEQGLDGSKYFVDNFPERKNIELMLQVDMANGIGTIDLMLETQNTSAPRWLVQAAVEEYFKLGYEQLRYASVFFSVNYALGSGIGSDHEAFLQWGIPAIDFTTQPDDPIHTPQDNFQNFDVRGLKRSGDVILKLVERFDNGVPVKSTEEYFLFLLGQTPIFIPLWSCWLCMLASFCIVVFSIIKIRKQHIRSDGKYEWTFFKISLFTFIIVCSAWFSSNLVGLLNGIRHPWLAFPNPFYVLAILGVLLGISISAWLMKKYPLTKSPYKLFRSGAIILLITMLLTSLLSVKISLAPAVALLLCSLAILVKNKWLKLLLLALSPLWMIRLIFSEWSEVMFRFVIREMPSDVMTSAVFNGAMVLFLCLYVLPLLYLSAAVFRTMPSFTHSLRFLKSKRTVLGTFTMFFSFAFLLTNVPAHNKIWQREIEANIEYNLETTSGTFKLRSFEYLNDIEVTYNGKRIKVNERVTEKELPFPALFDSSLTLVHRTETKNVHGDTTDYNIELTITSKKRPYKVDVSYSSSAEQKPPEISTPLRFTTKKDTRVIEWFSFPDTLLAIPVQFQVVGNDTVKEKIRVVFSELPEGVKIQGEKVNVVPRMEYFYRKEYR